MQRYSTTLQLTLVALLAFGTAGDLFAAEKAAAKPAGKPPEKMKPVGDNKAAPTSDVDPAPPPGAKLEAGKPVGDGWIALFNGKDFSGFKLQSEFWKVEDGVLHGTTPGGKEHHYAYTEKEYGDFELHADVKLVGYNSGVCIRIAPTAGNFDNVPGYQVDMGDGFWGCLYDEKGRNMIAAPPKEIGDKILHKDDWNHYYVIAQGPRIQIWFNGVKTVDVIDEPGRRSGPIGFQLCHGRTGTDAQFKNVYLRPIGK